MKKNIYKIVCIFIMVALTSLVLYGCSPKNVPVETLTKYDIELSVDTDNMTITASQKVFYQNNTDNALTTLNFNLYPNAFREGAKYKPYGDLETKKAFPVGINYGNISILTVKNESGDKLAYSVCGIDDNILSITIDELYPTDSVAVIIDYTVKLTNSTLRLGYTDNAISIGNFYPILCVYEGGYYEQPYHSNGDPFYSDVSNYNVTVEYPEKFKIVGTGTSILSECDKKGWAKQTFDAQKVRDFALVMSDKFEVVKDNYEGTEISYYYFDDEKHMESLKTAKQSIATYSALFGKYPYADYDVCQVDFLAGGMEYPSLVYIGATEDYEFYTEVIVHETAHQWWYGVVGNNEIDYAWLDEGLTEFSTALYYKHNGDMTTYKNKINEALKSYTMFVDLSYKIEKPNTSMSRPSYAYKTDVEYYYMTYVKGLIMFNSIYELAGEQKFYAAMQLYYKDNYLKNATPAELSQSLKKAVGHDFDTLLAAWIDGKVYICSIGSGYR